MKYAVDRIENDIAILENLSDGSTLEIKISLLPTGIKEKDIVRLENDKYILDVNEKDERLKRIREKMNRLKR